MFKTVNARIPWDQVNCVDDSQWYICDVSSYNTDKTQWLVQQYQGRSRVYLPVWFEII